MTFRSNRVSSRDSAPSVRVVPSIVDLRDASSKLFIHTPYKNLNPNSNPTQPLPCSWQRPLQQSQDSR